MANISDTVYRICDDLTRQSSDIGPVVQREILSACEFYAGQRLGFNERVLSFTLSQTQTYSLDTIATANSLASVLAVDDVRYTVSSRYIVLDPVPMAEWRRLDTTSSETGPPDFFAVFNKSLYVYTTPDASYDATMACHVKLLSLDGEVVTSNGWLEEGLELITARATRMTLAKKLDDFEKAQVYAGIEGECFARLLEQRSLLMETGRLVPHD